MHMERLLQLSPYINRPVEITPCNIYHIRMDNMFQKIPLYPMGKEIFHFSFSIQILHDTLFSGLPLTPKTFFFSVTTMHIWRHEDVCPKILSHLMTLIIFTLVKKKLRLCCAVSSSYYVDFIFELKHPGLHSHHAFIMSVLEPFYERISQKSYKNQTTLLQWKQTWYPIEAERHGFN